MGGHKKIQTKFEEDFKKIFNTELDLLSEAGVVDHDTPMKVMAYETAIPKFVLHVMETQKQGDRKHGKTNNKRSSDEEQLSFSLTR